MTEHGDPRAELGASAGSVTLEVAGLSDVELRGALLAVFDAAGTPVPRHLAGLRGLWESLRDGLVDEVARRAELAGGGDAAGPGGVG